MTLPIPAWSPLPILFMLLLLSYTYQCGKLPVPNSVEHFRAAGGLRARRLQLFLQRSTYL